MPYGYVVAHVEVTDQNAFEKYSSQVPLVTERFGGQYLARAGQQASLEGIKPLGNRTVIIRFHSLLNLDFFFFLNDSDLRVNKHIHWPLISRILISRILNYK